jgi:hypothetical protein
MFCQRLVGWWLICRGSKLSIAPVWALVLLHMSAEAAGHTLKFASLCSSVRELLDLTNLVAAFDAYRSVPEAIAAMHQEEICSA